MRNWPKGWPTVQRWGQVGAHSCCSGLDAIPRAAERLRILWKALTPGGHPRSPRAGAGRGRVHPGVRRLVSARGGSTAVVLGHSWWAGRGRAGAARGNWEPPASAMGLLLPFCLILTYHWCGPGSAPPPPAPPHVVVWPLPLLWSWPHPSLWLWSCPTVAPWRPVPKGQCQHGPETPHLPALGLGQQCLRVPRATAAVAQVPRAVPRASRVLPHTGHCSCQPHCPVPTQTCSRGTRQTGLAARTVQGLGPFPLPRAKSQSHSLQGGSSGCWTFCPEGPVGWRQGCGMGQDPVPHPRRAVRDPAVLLAEGTARGGPRGLCRVPGPLDRGCQEGPDKHLASLFIYDRGYLYRKVL